MREYYLLYDPRDVSDRNNKRYYGLPVAILTRNQAYLIREWPPSHLVLHFRGDEARTITETTVASFQP